jgi:UDP-N-acetylmuramate dehydrogenase
MNVAFKIPQVKGRVREEVSLAGRCWFGVGGAADVLFTPHDDSDLCQFLRSLDTSIPVMPLGVGSNILVRDGGVRGVVVRMGRDMATISHNNNQIIAGAGALDVNVARYASELGLSGLEFLVGIPGTIGGAARMNAGAYGADMAACVDSITAVDRRGVMHHISNAEAGFTYRHSAIPDDWIITSVTFNVAPDNAHACIARMNAISEQREVTQPVRSKTGGSTFKNPEGHKAWQLIDAAGCRGLARGDAQISELHCNFMINHGNASAEDLETLGEEVREKVFVDSGITLEWEIKILGERK